MFTIYRIDYITVPHILLLKFFKMNRFFGPFGPFSVNWSLSAEAFLSYHGPMRQKWYKTVYYILSMREEAWGILLGTLRLSCAMVFCAFIILIHLGAPTLDTMPIWQGALEYAKFPAWLLLCAVLASAFLDEHLR